MNASDHCDVLVVGSYVQDHAWFTERFPEVGETRLANAFNTGPGGKGFNQAVACARQGVATMFIGAIGDDHLGGIAREFARGEALACRWQVHDEVATAASSIIVDAEGRNQIVFNPGANLHLDPDFIVAQDGPFATARILLLQLENNIEATAAALDRATRRGLLRVLNPAPLHEDFDAALLAQCDIVTPNETEFALLHERCTGERIAAADLAARDDADLHALARRIRVASVVITLGARGCFVSHADRDLRGDPTAFYRLGPERVKAIDSTGAGDAFNGALVAALLRFGGRPFHEAVRHANRSAALSTEAVGTAPVMPRFDEVIARFPA
jgi:ribokinase